MPQSPHFPSGQIPLIGAAPSDLYEAKPFPAGLPKIFFDTSVISTIVLRGTYAPRVAAEITASRDLWRRRGELFNPVISAMIEDELKRGDSQAAQRRIVLVKGVGVLDVTPEIKKIVKFLCLANAFRRNPDKRVTPVMTLAVSPTTLTMSLSLRFTEFPFSPRLTTTSSPAAT